VSASTHKGSRGSSPILAARERLGLSRDELGRLLGVSGRTVSYWESGRKLPLPERTAALAEKLGLSGVELRRATHRASPKVLPERSKPW
jgi:DNA-binding transcriptional regulator YiaG